MWLQVISKVAQSCHTVCGLQFETEADLLILFLILISRQFLTVWQNRNEENGPKLCWSK